MTINTYFFDYQRDGENLDPTVFGRCSPALVALRNDLEVRWLTTNLGCYGPRPIRGATAPSTHSWGAAIDLGLALSPPQAREEICAYLVAWSAEWGVQAVHDYLGCRIWRAGRTPNAADACTLWWRAQRRSTNGMGQPWANWLHIEVLADRWSNGQSAQQRGIT